MQNNALTTNIYESTNKTIGTINEAQRLLTSELAGVNKNLFDTIAQNAVSIERTAANNQATTERVANQLSTSIERNGANNMATTERVNSQLATAVERNGGNILTAIEKVAGEGRLTTTVTDAASRQAANDSARDILAAVERNGTASVASSKDAYNGLLASIERNSGENRMTTITADGASQARLADTRRDIISNLNSMEGEILSIISKNNGDISTSISQTAWETRQNQTNHYSSLLNELQKNGSAIALQTAQNYASLLLEGQKLAHHSDSKGDAHFAAMISKQDNQFAALLLEQQKTKECLTLQLQDAKYEALKNKQELSKELSECCCEIKMKVDQRTQDILGNMDSIDRDRLRDGLTQATNEASVLKILDWYDDRGYGRRGRRHHH
jgi:hypothetical protein